MRCYVSVTAALMPIIGPASFSCGDGFAGCLLRLLDRNVSNVMGTAQCAGSFVVSPIGHAGVFARKRNVHCCTRLLKQIQILFLALSEFTLSCRPLFT
jgi:hypothetical protein